MNRMSNGSIARARSSAVERDHGSRTWTAWQSVASSISGPSASRRAPNLARSSSTRAAVPPAYQVPYGGVPGGVV